MAEKLVKQIGEFEESASEICHHCYYNDKEECPRISPQDDELHCMRLDREFKDGDFYLVNKGYYFVSISKLLKKL